MCHKDWEVEIVLFCSIFNCSIFLNADCYWKPENIVENSSAFRIVGFSTKGQQRGKTAPSPKDILVEKKTAPLPKSIWVRGVQCWLCQVDADVEHNWPFVTAWHCFGLVYCIWTFKRQILPCSESVKHKCILITWHPLMKTLHQPCMNIQYLNTVLQLCYVHYKCE